MNDTLIRATKPRRLTPPLWWWIFLGLVVVAIAALQITYILNEQGFTNMVCTSLGMLATLVLLVWFMFRSGFSWRSRLASLAGLVVAGAVFFVWAYEIKGVTGNMVFVFEMRDTMRHFLSSLGLADPVREMPTGAGATVDLTTTTPDDFWQFLGPNRDEAVENVKLSRDWASKPPKLLWNQAIGAGWSAFSVVNGFAVTMEQRGDKEMITCYEVKTGKMQWEHGHNARYEFFIAGTGPRSTPTIHQGRIYALGATGILFCLDGGTGKEIWKRDLLKDFDITPGMEKETLLFGRANSPLIVNDLVVIPAGNKVSLVAYNKKTGELVWKGGDQQISYSSPVLATLKGKEQILIVNSGSVSGHDPADGKVLWQFDWPGDSSKDANSSQAVPVGEDKVFVSKGYQAGAALYQLKEKQGGTFEPEQLWHNKKLLRTKFTNVAIKDGLVFGLSDGLRLDCADLLTGKKKWDVRGFGHGQILRVGELLLVLSEEGEVSLLEASAQGGGTVLGNFKALEGVTWNNLALYGPYLLIRNGKEAACYELPVEN